MQLTKNSFLYFWIIVFTLITTLVLWLPFLLRQGTWLGLSIPDSNFQYILKNYDGPLYIIVAKTFYNPVLINNLGLELFLSPLYFAAHLPLYPLMIKIFAFIFGYLQAMVLSNIFFTVILALFFLFFLKKLNLTTKPLILTCIFLFLPRFLVVRSIGAPESLFLLMILLSLYFFEKESYWLAGLFGGLATLTKIPGILLFPVYIITSMEKLIRTKKISWQLIGLLFIPFSLLGLFFFYQLQYGNFFAYFNQESFVPLVFPFSVFNFQKTWVGTAWLEDIIFYYFLYLIAVIYLYKSKFRSFFYFTLVFFIATTFVQHRDISRYSLPMWPIACIALEKFFTSKKFLLVFLILLPAIFLYAWNFIIYNILPISNWQAFL